MQSDWIISAGGIVYGVILISVVFVKSKITEPLRIDKLIFPNISEQTRLINLVAGICFTAYGIYSIL